MYFSLFFVNVYDGDVLAFFCFKQKTAYEMRISDWSSDVCSSDLRRQGVFEAGAEREDRHLAALPDDAALADRQRRAACRHLDAERLAARIADCRRPVVDLAGGRHHVHQLGLVARRPDVEVWQAAEVGEVVAALMGDAVGPVPAQTGRASVRGK